MTQEEIKLELAKYCLNSGQSLDTAKMFYEWVVDKRVATSPTSTITNDEPIIRILEHSLNTKRILNALQVGGIKTVGDLLKAGRYKVQTLRNFGWTCLRDLERSLAIHHIENWDYKFDKEYLLIH